MKALLKALTPILPAIIAVTFLGPTWVKSAGAQMLSPATQCTVRETAMKNLASKYDEVPVHIGLTNSGAIIEVTTSTDGESWSIILTTPAGVSCMVAAGEHWEQLQPKRAKFTPSADERVH